MRHITPALLLLATLVPAGAGAQTPAPKSARAGWPTVDRQLTEDRVAPDTAPAKLIRENQDFSLLRPEEAHDRLPVPAWLRVWWHKAQPEAEFSATDPTGGYPLVLKEIHEWMVSHPDLKGDHGATALQAETQEKRAGTSRR